MDKRFEVVDYNFGLAHKDLNRKFEINNRKFTLMDQKFEVVDQKFASLNQKWTKV